jgi:hypothetical protein
MAQIYEIPRFNTASPLAGIAQLYATYKGIERQDAQDQYAKEKDAKTFALQEQEVGATRDRTAMEAEIAARRMQHEGALQQAKMDWEKDPNNPDTKYRLAMADAALKNANTQAGLDAAHADYFGQLGSDLAATRELMSKFGNIILEAQQKAGQAPTPLGNLAPTGNPQANDKFVAQPIVAAQQYAPTPTPPGSLSDADLQRLVMQQHRAMAGVRGYNGISWDTPRPVGTNSRGAVR